MSKKKGKMALGRGLSALIPGAGESHAPAPSAPAATEADDALRVMEIELSRITANNEQPRKHFKDEALNELAASIKEKGVIQPVLVRREPDGSFMLIAGERRYRASHLAGVKTIPAIVRDDEGADSLEIALIENIQREDLNPMETAIAFDRLQSQFGLTQEQLSDKVGKERATVANYLRLLGLPAAVKEMVSAGSLSMGHARAILAIEGDAGRIEAAKKIVKAGLSVREAERLAKKNADNSKGTAPAGTGDDPHVRHLEDKLTRHLGSKVKINHKGKAGTIQIGYHSLEDLDRLLDMLIL